MQRSTLSARSAAAASCAARGMHRLRRPEARAGGPIAPVEEDGSIIDIDIDIDARRGRRLDPSRRGRRRPPHAAVAAPG